MTFVWAFRLSSSKFLAMDQLGSCWSKSNMASRRSAG
jgi:hypothetical protein